MPVVVPMVPPANLLGFEMIDLALGDERRLCRIATRGRKTLHWLDRRQRRRVRAGRKRRRPRNNSETEFQKFPTFHDISSCSAWWVDEGEFRCDEMNVR